MRAKLFLSLVFVLYALSGCAAEAETEPAKLNRRLKEELALAKSPGLYFVFDLERNNIQLKSRGMVLKEWRIEKARFWGTRPGLKTFTLVKKSALFAPKRKKIKPGEAEEQGAKFELEALEQKDMPSRYAFYLDGGIRLYFSARARRFFPRVANVGRFFSWYLGVPLKNLWYEINKKPFTGIDIKLTSKEDSQAIYWSFSEGMKGLFFN